MSEAARASPTKMTKVDERKAKAVELAYTKMLTTKRGTFKTVKTLASIKCAAPPAKKRKTAVTPKGTDAVDPKETIKCIQGLSQAELDLVCRVAALLASLFLLAKVSEGWPVWTIEVDGVKWTFEIINIDCDKGGGKCKN